MCLQLCTRVFAHRLQALHLMMPDLSEATTEWLKRKADAFKDGGLVEDVVPTFVPDTQINAEVIFLSLAYSSYLCRWVGVLLHSFDTAAAAAAATAAAVVLIGGLIELIVWLLHQQPGMGHCRDNARLHW